MRRIQMIFGILLVFMTTPVLAQEISTTYCMSGIKYTGPEEDLKDELLTAAKQEAVQELFGEEIASLTEVENFALTEEQIRTNALTILRIQGEPVYSNGQNFGEVCVTIDAYATEEDNNKFKPQTLTKKTCKEGDERTIKQATEEKAILRALTAYDQQVKDYPPEKVLPLLRDVTFSEGGFDPETEFYCARVRGVLYPIELMGVLVPVKPTPTPEPRMTRFTIYFTGYEIGDIPTSLGRKLIIGQDENGNKYIRAQTPEPLGEIEIKELSLSDTFEFTMTFYWRATYEINRYKMGQPRVLKQSPNFSQSVLFLSDTGEEIKIEFVKGGNITFGNLTRHYKRSAWKIGVNDIKVVVKGNQAKMFINDQIFGSTLVKPGGNYSTVIVKGIMDYDAIYKLSVRKL
jgi:hypothetical protein